ncbi:MAG: aldo/keto reductase [Clostridia bacterium]
MQASQIKKLGFGLMRLPMCGEEVDIEQTKQMVDLFMEKGFTYFDTAYGYLGGKSEEAAKTALVDRYPRESFLLATKLPAWASVKTAEEAKEMFWTSLGRTGAGYFDYYLFHNCGGERTKVFDDFGIWDFLAARKREGLIKRLGFSFHDNAATLESLLQAHPDMDFVQLQINYADWESSSIESRKCFEVARAHGKPVIVMEPVKGGSLANLPEQVSAPMRQFAPEASLSSWAIRYAASLEGVITVLSGMSTPSQMRDNLSTMEHFTPLSAQEQQVIAEVQNRLASVERIPCTDCRYCVKDCPQGIQIPGIFSMVNHYKAFGNLQGAKDNYAAQVRKSGKASACIACGQCEMACPQHIAIIEELKKAAQSLED